MFIVGVASGATIVLMFLIIILLCMVLLIFKRRYNQRRYNQRQYNQKNEVVHNYDSVYGIATTDTIYDTIDPNVTLELSHNEAYFKVKITE